MSASSRSPRPRAVASRRAAIAVLSGLVAFAALQLGGAAALDRWLPGAVDPTYGARLHAIRMARREAGPGGLTVVMLGSSRVYNGFATRTLSESLSRDLGRPVKVVNAAFPSCGPFRELLTWRRLRRDGVRPDLLLVEASPGYLTDGYAFHELSEEIIPAGQLRWADLSLLQRYQAGNRTNVWGEAARAASVALYVHRMGVLKAVAPRLVPRETASLMWPPGPSFLPPDLPAERKAKALTVAHGEYTGALAAADPNSVGGRALAELLASCRDAHVPAALVLMPEGPAFRSWYPPGKRPALHAWLEQTTRAYGATAVDAQEWIDEGDFMDSHHMFPRGAEKFSERLGREYLGPWLRRLAADGPP